MKHIQFASVIYSQLKTQTVHIAPDTINWIITTVVYGVQQIIPNTIRVLI